MPLVPILFLLPIVCRCFFFRTSHQGLKYGNDPFAGIVKLDYANTGQSVGTIYVGSSLQPFRVLFDTGSSETWLPSNACNSNGCAKHKKLRTIDETTSIGDSVLLTYGTGYARLRRTIETLTVGSFEIPKYQLLSATYLSPKPFTSTDFDGIVGLTLSTQAKTDSLLNRLIQGGNISSRIFGVALFSDSNQDSTISLGKLDPRFEQRVTEATWFSVTDSDQWAIPLLDVFVGGKKLGLCAESPDSLCNVIIDTGTTGIGGSYDKMLTIAEALGAVPRCEEEPLKKHLEFVFLDRNGSPISITFFPEDYVSEYTLSSIEETSCPIKAQPVSFSSTQRPTLVLGQMLFLHNYVIFDKDNESVGLINYNFQTEEL